MQNNGVTKRLTTFLILYLNITIQLLEHNYMLHLYITVTITGINAYIII